MKIRAAGWLFALCASICFAAEQEDKVPGIDVGKKAPDFVLKDQDGVPQKLSKLLEKGPVAVVFHRSAQW